MAWPTPPIRAIAGIDDPTRARVLLYQAEEAVHAPLSALGLGGGGGGGPVAWTDITGKPATYPPTLPIPESGVTNLVTDLAGKEPVIAPGNPSYYWAGDKTWKPVSAGGGVTISDTPPASPIVGSLWMESDSGSLYVWWDDGTSQQWVATASLEGMTGPQGPIGPAGPTGPAGTTDWAGITGKPSTFPPTLPIAESDVTNLVSDLAAKAPLASPALTGSPTAPTVAGSDNSTALATTAWVKAQGYGAGGGGIAEAPNDGKLYARKSLGWDDLTDDFAAKEAVANKGVANGYAPLDASSKISATYLPAYVDDVVEYANLAAFPATGTAGLIYVALDTNKIYRWSGSAYIEISPSPGSSDAVPEGTTNLYYTTARSALKADLASPTFTGDPKAPTPTAGDADTSIATTAFVSTAITNASVPPPATVAPLMDGTAAVGTTTKYAREDHKHPTDTSREPTITAGLTSQYYRGDKTFVTLDKTAVGLGNVSNTAQVTAVSGTAPVVSSGGLTPAISMAAATSSVDGYLKATDWVIFNAKGSGTVTGVTGTAPVVSSGGTAPSISMAAATSTVDGYLKATDWVTFNGKASLASPVFTGDPQAPTPLTADNDTSIATTAFVKAQGYVTSSGVTAVSGTAPVVSSGGTTPAISMAAATASVDGYLTAANFTTFNGKEPALAVGTTAQYYRGDKSWQILNAAAVGLGNVSNTAQVTSVTGTAPVVSSGGTTPAISMAAATSLANGYLASGDWTTFNNKAPTASPVFTGNPTGPTPATADNSVSLATTAFVKAQGYVTSSGVTSVTGTAPVASSGGNTPAISMAAATASVDGYLKATDFTTFNNKEPAISSGTTSQFWRGDKSWQALPIDVAFISDTAPGSPVAGQFWYETDTAALYLYYNDGTSSQWVQVAGPGV